MGSKTRKCGGGKHEKYFFFLIRESGVLLPAYTLCVIKIYSVLQDSVTSSAHSDTDCKHRIDQLIKLN